MLEDFELIRELGRGAFGCVIQVRNRVDGQMYSLKRIQLTGNRRIEKVLREARLLSSLHHERVQRYFQAWVEEVPTEVGGEGEGCGDGKRHGRGHPPPPPAAGGRGGGDGDDKGGPVRGGGDAARGHGGDGEMHTANTTTHGAAAMIAGMRVTDGEEDGDGRHDPAVGAVAGDGGPDSPTSAPAAPPPPMTCNICRSLYHDWSVSFNEWSRLDAALQPLNLCPACYRAALVRMGVDLSVVLIKERARPPPALQLPLPPALPGGRGGKGGDGGTSHPPAASTTRFLFILTEYCDRTLMEEVRGIAPRVDSLPPGHPLLLALEAHDNAVAAAVAGGAATAPSGGEVPPATLDMLGGGWEGVDTVYAMTHAASSKLWSLFWQVVEGLAYLHTTRIVHRDLKPSNVFCTGREVGASSVKIGDLGLAITLVGGSASSPGGGGGSGVVQVEAEADGEVGGKRSRLREEGRGHEGGGAKRSKYDGPSGGGGGGVHGGDVSHFASLSAASGGHIGPGKRGGTGVNVATEGAKGRDTVSVAIHRHRAAVEEARWGWHEGEGHGGDHAGPSSSHHHGDTRGVGTLLYMPPEASDGHYSDRSDMYSLGVVLYEMWSRFADHEERLHMLTSLKAGVVPRSFLSAFPVQAQLISNLMQPEPDKRPSASDLLRYRYFAWSPATTAAWNGLAMGMGGASHGGGPSSIPRLIMGVLKSNGPLLSGEVAPSPGITATAAAFALPTGSGGGTDGCGSGREWEDGSSACGGGGDAWMAVYRRQAPTLVRLAGDVTAVETAGMEELRLAAREALHLVQGLPGWSLPPSLSRPGASGTSANVGMPGFPA